MRIAGHAGSITRLAAIFLGVLSLACLFCGTARSDERFSAEAVKAAYLYRIPGYVQWPGTRPPDAPFTIDVLGDSAVADELEHFLLDHPVQGHPARVRIIRRIADLGDAQMLYIGPQFAGDVHAAIAQVADRPVLIVTDEQYGLNDGSTINFVEGGEHVRFEVSLVAARRAGLKISSQLLSVAARVEGGHLGSGVACEYGRLMNSADFPCPTGVLVRLASGKGGTLR